MDVKRPPVLTSGLFVSLFHDVLGWLPKIYLSHGEQMTEMSGF